MERALAGVPHHFGFCTSLIVCADTEPILNGPPDRSMAGFTVEQLGIPSDLLHDVSGQEVAEEHLPVGERGLELDRDRVAPVGSGDRCDVAVACDARHVGRGGHRIAALLLPGVLEVRRSDRDAVGPHRLGVQGVDDRLRLGADQLGLHDQVGVRRGRVRRCSRRTGWAAPPRAPCVCPGSPRRACSGCIRSDSPSSRRRWLPPATPTYVTVVPPPPLLPHAAASTASAPRIPTIRPPRRGRRPRPVTAAGDPV